MFNLVKLEVAEEDDLSCNNSCFICLQPVTAINEAEMNSLKVFFNFLKISEMKDIFACEECGEKLTKFASFCKTLEKIRLEMDLLLGFVQSAISNSNKTFEMASEGFASVRECVMKRCNEKIQGPKPEIVLQRIDVSNPVRVLQTESDSKDSTHQDNSATPVISEILNIKVEVDLEKASKQTRKKASKRSFKCTKCSKTFQDGAKLKRHNDAIHLCLKPFNCPKCSKSFSEKKTWRVHIEAVHLSLKPYKCDKCDQTFAYARNLKRHKALPHKLPNSKLFPCESCEKGFDSWHSLKRHKTIHTEQSRTCDICKKIFRDSYDLKLHVSSVHEKQRHYCQACDRSYAFPSALVGHYKLEHPGLIVPKKSTIHRS